MNILAHIALYWDDFYQLQKQQTAHIISIQLTDALVCMEERWLFPIDTH